jgi:DNA-binding transcriptional ArsR family regulator
MSLSRSPLRHIRNSPRLTRNQLVAYCRFVDEVFKALADPTRRELLDRLRGESGQTLTELCWHLAMTRQAVTKHLAILESANLVTTVRQGREKLHYLNPVPIGEIYDRWIGKYEKSRVAALADLKRALENKDESE